MTDDVSARLDQGAARMDGLQDQIDALRNAVAENTAITRQIHEGTTGLIDLLESFRAGFKVLEKLGTIARPLGSIIGLGAAIAGIWAAFKGGGK